MDFTTISGVLVITMGVLLYVMRRRSRQGRRTPKF
jgi:hypothetical protein